MKARGPTHIVGAVAAAVGGSSSGSKRRRPGQAHKRKVLQRRRTRGLRRGILDPACLRRIAFAIELEITDVDSIELPKHGGVSRSAQNLGRLCENWASEFRF